MSRICFHVSLAPLYLGVPDTIADGLKASMGDLTWPIVRDKVDGVVTVEVGPYLMFRN